MAYVSAEVCVIAHWKTYPVTSGLGDIFTDLLGGETKRTDLGSECGRSTNLTTSGTEVDNLLLVGVELWGWT